MKPCKVIDCDNGCQYGDNLFCHYHREKWREVTENMNTNYTEEEKDQWIQMFTEAKT